MRVKNLTDHQTASMKLSRMVFEICCSTIAEDGFITLEL